MIVFIDQCAKSKDIWINPGLTLLALLINISIKVLVHPKIKIIPIIYSHSSHPRTGVYDILLSAKHKAILKIS